MSIKNNQVTFQILSASDEKWYTEYPGFCNLQSESGKKCSPFFCSGVGLILNSETGAMPAGSKVAFIGYADSHADILHTSINSVIKIAQDVDELPVKYAVAVSMFYALCRLKPQAGMKFYVDSDIRDADFLEKIIYGIGCSRGFENGLYDGAVCDKELPDGIALTSNAKIVAKKDLHATGEDFTYKKYMSDGWTIPDHYMLASTAKNMASALSFFGISTEKKTDKLPDTGYVMSDFSFAHIMRQAFAHHINPVAMKISVTNKDADKALKTARGIAFYVINGKVIKQNSISCGDQFLQNIVFDDGSVADCFGICGNLKNYSVEMHFDNTSLVYQDGKYCEYKGDGMYKKGKKEVAPLAEADENNILNIAGRSMVE